MQTLTLNLSDTGMDKVMAFLKNLPSEEVQVVENSAVKALPNKAKSVNDLYGILAPYSKGCLSDEAIEGAIAQGAYESGMAGKTNG